MTELPENRSILHVLAVGLERRWVIIGCVLLVTLPVALHALLSARSYTSTLLLRPSVAEGARVPGIGALAGQLGLALPFSDGARSPQFYVDLLRSVDFLQSVVQEIEDRGALSVLDPDPPSDEDPAERSERLSERVREQLSPTVFRESGIIELRATTPDPALSQIMLLAASHRLLALDVRLRQVRAREERLFLDERLGEVAGDLQELETELLSFLVANRRFQESPETLVRYERLQRQVTMQQELLLALRQAHEQASLEERRTSAAVAVVVEPRIPARPDPRGTVIRSFVAGLAGFALGILVLALEAGFRRVGRTHPDDVSRLREALRRLPVVILLAFGVGWPGSMDTLPFLGPVPLWAQVTDVQTSMDGDDGRILRWLVSTDLTRPQMEERLQGLGRDVEPLQQYFAALDQLTASEREALERLPPPSPPTDVSPDVERALFDLGWTDLRTERPDRVGSPVGAEGDRPPMVPQAMVARFGSDVFVETGRDLPPRVGPVPGSYQVGAGDELTLILTGDVELRHRLEVGDDGQVAVPRAGFVSIGGMSLNEVRSVLTRELAQIYSGLEPDGVGRVALDVAIARPRPMRVYVIGEVRRPGPYVVSAVASVLDVLMEAGGPAEAGSYRSVRVVRGAEQVGEVDLYDFLTTGRAPVHLNLRDGDVILVSPVGPQVSVQGAARRLFTTDQMRAQVALERLGQVDGDLDHALAALQEWREAPRESALTQAAFRIEEERREERVRFLRERALHLSDQVERAALEWSDARLRSLLVELRPDEGLSHVMDLLGGLGPTGYAGRIQVEQPGRHDRPVMDLDLSSDEGRRLAEAVTLSDGDRVHLFFREDREAGVVHLTGPVNRPGRYALMDVPTLGALVDRAEGLLPEAIPDQIRIRRMDRETGLLRILRADITTGDGTALLLRDGDEVVIYPRAALHTDRFVRVSGSVQVPGRYRVREGITPDDLILMAGGFGEDADSSWVEVARPRFTTEAGEPITETMRVETSFGGGGGDHSVELRAGDHVVVPRLEGFRAVETVQLLGEVRRPGVYTLGSRDERISTLLERAGGLTSEAYSDGFRLVRNGLPVATNLRVALERPGSAEDLRLEPGDELHLPAYDPTVQVRGAVAFEARIRWRPGFSLDDYLQQAGGISEAGDRSRVSVAYMSGERAVTRRRLMIRRDPPVMPGTVIHVPQKGPDTGVDWGGVISTSLTVASTVATLVIAVNATR